MILFGVCSYFLNSYRHTLLLAPKIYILLPTLCDITMFPGRYQLPGVEIMPTTFRVLALSPYSCENRQEDGITIYLGHKPSELHLSISFTTESIYPGNISPFRCNVTLATSP
jgi:hypothetical protein